MSTDEMKVRDLTQAFSRADDMLAVHYACESFFEAVSPAAVSCIAITDVREGTTNAYSPMDLPPERDRVQRERDVLERFYKHLRGRQNAKVIHWNMNTASYGFAALETRYRYLADKEPPYTLPSSRVYDLDALITSQFGEGYAKHPKLLNLASLNSLSMRSFLSPESASSAVTRGVGWR